MLGDARNRMGRLEDVKIAEDVCKDSQYLVYWMLCEQQSPMQK